MLVGLTGGVASGKSTVAAVFADAGVPVIDTDIVAREVVAPGSAGLQRVSAEFGPAVVAEDGSLDRARLRERIFADEADRKRLESILHPLILEEVARQSRRAGGIYQIHVIPLLVETGLQDTVHRVLVVDCPEQLQVSRLRSRDGETTASAEKILASQAVRARRLAAADDVIVNDGDAAELPALVAILDAFYRDIAGSGKFSARGLRLP
jgi:dephospho-CoA kinase